MHQEPRTGSDYRIIAVHNEPLSVAAMRVCNQIVRSLESIAETQHMVSSTCRKRNIKMTRLTLMCFIRVNALGTFWTKGSSAYRVNYRDGSNNRFARFCCLSTS